MSDDAETGGLARVAFGRPALWMAVVWTALGVVWLVLAATDGPWRWVIGGIWIVLGVLRIAVALSDRRHARGRYARR